MTAKNDQYGGNQSGGGSGGSGNNQNQGNNQGSGNNQSGSDNNQGGSSQGYSDDVNSNEANVEGWTPGQVGAVQNPDQDGRLKENRMEGKTLGTTEHSKEAPHSIQNEGDDQGGQGSGSGGDGGSSGSQSGGGSNQGGGNNR